MKIVKIEESNRDSAELEILKKDAAILSGHLKVIQDRIREIIYKYDTAKMDYTRKR
jgi:hypothetical protein